MVPLNVQHELTCSMYHQQRSFQRKMYRSWKDATMCAKHSRIELIASKLIGTEKGDNRLATEHALEDTNFTKRLEYSAR